MKYYKWPQEATICKGKENTTTHCISSRCKYFESHQILPIDAMYKRQIMKGPIQFNKEPYSMNMSVMFLHQILHKCPYFTHGGVTRLFIPLPLGLVHFPMQARTKEEPFNRLVLG